MTEGNGKGKAFPHVTGVNPGWARSSADAPSLLPPGILLYASPEVPGVLVGGTKATWLLAEQLLQTRGEVTWNRASSQ